MLGYIVTLIAAAIGTLAFVHMDLEAPSHFFSLFLPFLFFSSLLFCFVAVVVWVFWKFGAPSGSDGGGWFWAGSDGIGGWYRSSSEDRSSSDGSSSDSSSGSGDSGGGD
jgi:hypothetical protein